MGNRKRAATMNHPNLISQVCLNCTACFVVLECTNFNESTCKGCEDAHCCRQCGSSNTRPRTKGEIEETMDERYAPPSRALYECGDCGLQFTQEQCASYIGDGTTCIDDCQCEGADKDDVHRCPMCLTLNGHYAGPISKKRS